MKTIALWLSGLTALFLFSCTKDVNEATALEDYSTSSRFNPSSQKPAPELAIEFSVNPVASGTTTYLNINMAATCGKIMVERAIDDNEEYTTAANATDWEYFAGDFNVNGSTISVPVTLSEIGTWGFRVHYIASGGQGGPCNYSNDFKELDLVVEAACGPLSLSGLLTGSTALGNNEYEFTVTYTVEACDEVYTDTKLQGGLTAFVGTPSINPPTGSSVTTNQLNQNYVIAVRNNEVTGKTTYTVTFTKTVTGAPGTNELTGTWSFSAKDANGNDVRVECDRIYF